MRMKHQSRQWGHEGEYVTGARSIFAPGQTRTKLTTGFQQVNVVRPHIVLSQIHYCHR